MRWTAPMQAVAPGFWSGTTMGITGAGGNSGWCIFAPSFTAGGQVFLSQCNGTGVADSPTGMINGKWTVILDDNVSGVATIWLSASLNSPYAQPRCLSRAGDVANGATLVAAVCTGQPDNPGPSGLLFSVFNQ
eukprot:gene9538-9702_t